MTEKGHQLSFGLAEELLKLSIREGWERDYPDTWLSGSTEHGRQRYKVRYNAQVFAILARAAACRGKREDPLWHDGLSGSAQRQPADSYHRGE